MIEQQSQRSASPTSAALNNSGGENIMNAKTAAEMAGLIDPRNVGQAEHPITADEWVLAVEIGHEIATAHGIDLDTLVRENEAAQRSAGIAMGYTDAEIDRMWAGT